MPEPRYDLTSFSLVEMTRCGSQLRSLGAGATSQEELGDRLVRMLFDSFVDPETGEHQCALVRLFKTHPYGDLPDDLREFASGTTSTQLADDTLCLTLLATAGLQEEWNSRAASVGHKAIPLPSQEAVHELPMIAQMLEQFGLEIRSGNFLASDIFLDEDQKTFNVFHVAEAGGSPFVPAQEGFVVPWGIRSVVGFGGVLPSHDMFAVILFCRARVPEETAELFPPLALNTLAAFHHVDPAATFVTRAPGPAKAQPFESRTYEELLRVQDRILLEQWERLEAAEKDRDQFFSLSVDMLCVADMEGYFRRVNPSFSRTLGYTDEELLAKPFADLIHPDDRAATAEVMQRLAEGGEIEQFYNRYRRKDGSYRWLSWSCPAPVGDSGSLYAVARDITHNVEQEEHLREARAAAEAANLAKDAFLANMSHEIRTPLNSILGFTQLVLGTELQPAQRHWLETVMHSGQSLIEIINDILDYSKMQAGKFSLESCWFGLRETVGQTVDALTAQANACGLELTSHVDADVPDVLRGDPGRIRQVITNLLANAIKFTPQGEVGVRVRVDSIDDESVVVCLTVHDTGIGIPADEHETIFAPFSQVDISASRRYAGTGLGLSICASLISQMEGEIRVESEAGEGSTFHVAIPFAYRPGNLTAEVYPSLAGVRVVVADDNDSNRDCLDEYLRAWGMHPSNLASAAGALQEMREAIGAREPVPLLIASSDMPEMDGFELVARVHALSGSCPAILMLTAKGLPEGIARAESLGAAWVVKPVKPSALLEAIQKTKPLGEPVAVTSDSRDAATQRPSRRLKILLAEDSETNQQLFVALLQRRGHEVVIASDGDEALDLARAGDFDLILMDVQMPGHDGLEVTRLLRAEERQGRVVPPIIALTARATSTDRQACLEAGMVECITKPIQFQTFYDTMDRVMGAGAPVPGVDWSAALETVRGNRDLLQRLVATSRKEIPVLIDGIREALENDDLETVHRNAHTLRGIVGHLGARQSEERATRLEAAARAENAREAATVFSALVRDIEEVVGSLAAGHEDEDERARDGDG